jgi:hypothetical protein
MSHDEPPCARLLAAEHKRPELGERSAARVPARGVRQKPWRFFGGSRKKEPQARDTYTSRASCVGTRWHTENTARALDRAWRRASFLFVLGSNSR